MLPVLQDTVLQGVRQFFLEVQISTLGRMRGQSPQRMVTLSAVQARQCHGNHQGVVAQQFCHLP